MRCSEEVSCERLLRHSDLHFLPAPQGLFLRPVLIYDELTVIVIQRSATGTSSTTFCFSRTDRPHLQSATAHLRSVKSLTLLAKQPLMAVCWPLCLVFVFNGSRQNLNGNSPSKSPVDCRCALPDLECRTMTFIGHLCLHLSLPGHFLSNTTAVPARPRWTVRSQQMSRGVSFVYSTCEL